ncbi:hypothetical protein MHYP_G00311400 [Metynnis hypsauchen]
MLAGGPGRSEREICRWSRGLIHRHAAPRIPSNPTCCIRLLEAHPITTVTRYHDMSHKQIYYSDKYDDEKFEYRHVMLPKDIAKRVPKTHLMSETEWRNLGVQQSQGWVHYMIHQPEPHILLFRRPLPTPKSQ